MPIEDRDGKPLTLFRIQHELIADTTPEGWFKVMATGPYFRYRWSYGTRSGAPYQEIVGEHRGTAVCRAEPSLTVAWGMSIDSKEPRTARWDWAQEFIDPTVHGIWVDFFWCGALIDRIELARIDGGHGLIPFPFGTAEKRTVTEFEAAVAWLIHGLEEGQEHDNPGRYLERLSVAQVVDEHREGAGARGL